MPSKKSQETPVETEQLTGQTPPQKVGNGRGATEFHYYPRLPDELKVMIWRAAFPRATVQHVRLCIGDIKAEFRPEDSHVSASRSELNRSTWWDRINISQVDRIANEVVNNLSVGTKLCKLSAELPRKAKADKLEYAVHIHDDDIVCLHFTAHPYYFLSELEIADLVMYPLRNLRRVAFDLENLTSRGLSSAKKKKFDKPLPCYCAPSLPHKDMAFCPEELCNLMFDLPSAKTIYFIAKIGKLKDLNTDYLELISEAEDLQEPTLVAPDTAGNERGTREKKKKKKKKSSADQIRETMQHFREIAIMNNLETYEDRISAFYEVRRHNSKVLSIHRDFWFLIRRAEEIWKGIRNDDPLKRKVGFKLLVSSKQP